MYSNRPAPPPRPPRNPSIPAWLIVASMFCCFPVGIVLLWLRTDWPVKLRAWISVAIIAGLVFVFTLAALAPPQPATPVAADSPAPTPLPTVTHTVTATPPPSPSPSHTASPLRSKTTHPAVPHTHHPTPTPTVRHTHAASTCGAPANPYRLNLCGRGHLVTSPPSEVCMYFDCIPAFDDGTGYMVQCDDGTYSMSGGRPGTCSHHGGEGRPVRRG